MLPNQAIVEKIATTQSEIEYIQAAKVGDTEKILRLLSEGVNIETVDPDCKRTALFWTIRNNHPNTFQQLIARGANLYHRDFRGEHPLIVSTYHADGTCTRMLLDAGVPVDLPAIDGTTAIKMAISLGNENVTRLLLTRGSDVTARVKEGTGENNIDVFISLKEFAFKKNQTNCAILCRYYELFYASRSDNVGQVKALLLEGAIPDFLVYDFAGVNVKKLFDYRPGRKSPTVYDYIHKYPNEFLKSFKIKALLADFEDTSNDESSDEENVPKVAPGQTFILNQAQEIARTDRLRIYNNNLNTKPAGVLYEQFVQGFTDLKCVVYRGMHYDPAYFSKRKRQAHRELSKQGEPAVSFATQSTAGLANQLVVNENDPNLQKAHQAIMNFFAELKRKADAKEPITTTRNNKVFAVLYYRFIQAYVENYAQLFSEGMISRHYKAPNNMNPALSTTALPEKASCYASGVRMDNNHYLNPHYRRFTLKPKHPCVGVVYAYAMDLAYFFQNGCFILDHVFNDRLGIGHIKQFEYEVMFESFISGRYQIDRELFIFPSFAQYSPIYETRFGYTERKFNNDKDVLNSLPSNNIQLRRDFLIKVNERVAEGLANVLQMRIKAALATAIPQSWVVFPFKNKLLSEIPQSPQKKETWRQHTQGDPNQLLSPLANLNIDNNRRLVPNAAPLVLFDPAAPLPMPTNLFAVPKPIEQITGTNLKPVAITAPIELRLDPAPLPQNVITVQPIATAIPKIDLLPTVVQPSANPIEPTNITTSTPTSSINPIELMPIPISINVKEPITLSLPKLGLLPTILFPAPKPVEQTILTTLNLIVPTAPVVTEVTPTVVSTNLKTLNI